MPHRHSICQPLAANGQSLFLLSVEDDSPQEKSHFRTSQVLLRCDKDLLDLLWTHSPGLPEAFPHSRPVANPKAQQGSFSYASALLQQVTGLFRSPSLEKGKLWLRWFWSQVGVHCVCLEGMNPPISREAKVKNASKCHVVMISGAKHDLILCSPIMTFFCQLFSSQGTESSAWLHKSQGEHVVFISVLTPTATNREFLRRNLSSSNVDYLILQCFKVFWKQSSDLSKLLTTTPAQNGADIYTLYFIGSIWNEFFAAWRPGTSSYNPTSF